MRGAPRPVQPGHDLPGFFSRFSPTEVRVLDPGIVPEAHVFASRRIPDHLMVLYTATSL